MDDRVILRKGRAAGLDKSSAVTPDGVEYEQLMRDLNNATYNKYKNRADLRQRKDMTIDNDEGQDQKTFMLAPGMMIDYENSESNTQPRFDSNGPWRESIPWEF
jgi:hypothetical protein